MSRLAVLALFAALGCRAGGIAPAPTATRPNGPGDPFTDRRPGSEPEFPVKVVSFTPGLCAAETIAGPIPPAEDVAGESATKAIPADGSGITLAALEELALGRNPTIPQAGALVRQQEGLTVQSGLYPNPTVGVVQNNATQAGQNQAVGVFVSQEFVTAGKLTLAQEAGRNDIVLRNWQLSAQEMRVVNDIRIRFYEALGAQDAVRAAEELERSSADGVQVAQELLDARRGGRPDVLQAEMQLSLAQGAVRDARFRLEAARRHLANAAGVGELSTAPLVGDLRGEIPELEWDASLQRLLENSPLLKSQESELHAARVEVDLARAQAVPNVTVQVVAQRDYGQNFSSVSSLVALPVPLFNRNQGNIVTAQGVLAQQQREYERLRLALSDQLAESFRRYSSLRSDATRLRDEVLPRAAENLELTTEAYRLGRMDFLHVVDARRTYFQSKTAEIDALTELHKTVVEIDGLQLSGGLNPTEVGTALQTTPGAGGTGTRGVLLQQLEQQRGTGARNLPGAIQAAEH